MKLSSTKKILLYCTLITLIILVCVLSQMILFSFQTSSSKILPGVYINDYYVGGMTKSEAKEAIMNDLSGFLLDNNTVVINGDIELTIHASNIANVDVDGLVEKAYDTSREDGSLTYFDFIKMKFAPVNIETETILNWQNIYNLIELNQHLFYTAPIDASLMDYSFVDDQLKLIVSPSEIGYKINVWETATVVQEALVNNTSHVYAIMEIIEPNITNQSLMQMSESPIEYSQVFATKVDELGVEYYNPSTELQKIDDMIEPMLVMPNQSMSVKEFINYNDYSSNKYNIKHLHIPSIIYGCALQVGMSADEHNVSSYITDEMDIYPYGQEAVIDNDKDLVLRNNFANPVIIDLEYNNTNSTNRLICKIYTVESLEYTYIKSVIEEHDNMYFVKVYRVYANDTGGVLSRTLLEEHTYPIPPKIDEEEEEIIEQMS